MRINKPENYKLHKQYQEATHASGKCSLLLFKFLNAVKMHCIEGETIACETENDSYYVANKWSYKKPMIHCDVFIVVSMRVLAVEYEGNQKVIYYRRSKSDRSCHPQAMREAPVPVQQERVPVPALEFRRNGSLWFRRRKRIVFHGIRPRGGISTSLFS